MNRLASSSQVLCVGITRVSTQCQVVKAGFHAINLQKTPRVVFMAKPVPDPALLKWTLSDFQVGTNA
jgi:hypothetical protein